MSYDTLTLKGKTFVLVPQEEFKKLSLPALPPMDADGNYPAVAASRVTLARTIIRRRRAAGLTQRELAQAANIRVETLNRIENAKVTPDTATIMKLDRALKPKSRRRAG